MAFWLRRIVGECLALALCSLPLAAQSPKSVQPVLICSSDSSCITFNQQGELNADPNMPHLGLMPEISNQDLASPDASGLFGVRPTVRVKLTDGKNTWYDELPAPKHTANRAYWLTTGLSLAMTVGDVENSIYALRRQNVVEDNPLYGSHPGRGRYYAISLPIFAINAYMSYRWKREDMALRDAGIQGHKYVKWAVPNILNAAVHAFGIAFTAGATGR